MFITFADGIRFANLDVNIKKIIENSYRNFFRKLINP
jgi:hypothetical protein